MDSSVQPLKLLVYSSISTSPLDQSQITSILKCSRKNNLRDGITGILVYRNRSFIQVLEGDDRKVDDAFARIRQDERHSDVLKLYELHTEQRQFPEWQMAFNDNEDETIDGFSDFLKPYRSKAESQIPAGPLKKLLLRFKEINKR